MADIRRTRLNPDWTEARVELDARLASVDAMAGEWRSVEAEVLELKTRLEAIPSPEELMRQVEELMRRQEERRSRNPRFSSITATRVVADATAEDAHPMMELTGPGAVEIAEASRGGVAVFHDEARRQTVHLGPDGERAMFSLGGDDTLPGRVVLRCGDVTLADLDGDAGGKDGNGAVLYLSDKGGQQTVHLGPYQERTLFALGGSKGLPGRIVLRGDGHVSLADLDANAGGKDGHGTVLYLSDKNGHQTVHLGPYLNETVLALGGDNKLPGRIRLRAGGFKTTADLDGGAADGAVLYLNTPNDQQTTHLGPYEGETLLALGGTSLPGCIKVRDGNYETKITLDATSGDVKLYNADCAEDFDVEEADVEAGTVVVLTEHGSVRTSCGPYDPRVAGVVSGAGPFRPAIVLDRHASDTPRRPVALLGKAYCKVDAEAGPIEVGTLLTTSTVPGHAMAAGDPKRAFGAVLGKAMGVLKSGTGLIPILVALQ